MTSVRQITAFDGTRVVYRVHDARDDAAAPSAPDILLCDGIGCDGFIWKYLAPSLASRYRVIHPHMRGHGESEAPRDPQAVAIADLARDNQQVLDDVDSKQVILLGHSMGVQVALEHWRRAPQRVVGLVLICGSYQNPVATFHDAPTLRRALPMVRLLAHGIAGPIQRLWAKVLPTTLSHIVAEITEINGDLVREEDFRPYLDHLARMDPRTFIDMLGGAEAHSAGPFLSRIDVPTLVVSGSRDRFTPPWLSEQMADRIPTAERLAVAGGTHTTPIEQPTLVGLRIDRFLADNFGGG